MLANYIGTWAAIPLPTENIKCLPAVQLCMKSRSHATKSWHNLLEAKGQRSRSGIKYPDKDCQSRVTKTHQASTKSSRRSIRSTRAFNWLMSLWKPPNEIISPVTCSSKAATLVSSDSTRRRTSDTSVWMRFNISRIMSSFAIASPICA